MGFLAFQIVLFLFVIPLGSPLNDTITSEVGINCLHDGSNDVKFPIIFKIKGTLAFYAELELEGGGTFQFHIDSGSDLTWVQCVVPDAPNPHIIDGAPNEPYTPHSNFLSKDDASCVGPFAKGSESFDRCDYSLEYGDGDSTTGWLVKDGFLLTNTLGETQKPAIVFGCGFNQQSRTPPLADGLIGIGVTALGFQSQLKSQGLSDNVFSHCLTLTKPEGFGLFGHDSRATEDQGVWLKMKQRDNTNLYTAGPVTIHLDAMSSEYDLNEIVFDSGIALTHFTKDIFDDTLDMITRNLVGKNMFRSKDTEETCWYGFQPYKTIDEVKDKFKDIKLNFFEDEQNIVLQPKDYLYIGEDSHAAQVCLGILPTDSSMGNLNYIGAISMLDKLVVYDSEKKLIGWHDSVDCSFSTGADHRKSIHVSGLANVTTAASTSSSM